MKIHRFVFGSLAAASLTAALFVGCAVPNPNAGQPVITQGPAGPLTNPAPAYIPDPRFNSASNTASLVAAAVAPVNPYAGITDWAIKLAFAAAGMISGYVAQKKSTTTAQSMLTAVVQGVETATQAPTITAQSVKTTIASHAAAAGVQNELASVVQKVTG